jgi:hypothetical protein
MLPKLLKPLRQKSGDNQISISQRFKNKAVVYSILCVLFYSAISISKYVPIDGNKFVLKK